MSLQFPAHGRWPRAALRPGPSDCFGRHRGPGRRRGAPEPRGRGSTPTRYLGRWYEIARVPNALQDRCEGATSDGTKGGDGQYHVVQTCHIGSPTGPTKIWRGSGRIIAPAKIRIGFFGGFVHQDYWIIDRSDDYSWSIMGTPDPRYVWIMSRQPVLSPGQKAALSPTPDRWATTPPSWNTISSRRCPDGPARPAI